ncbi:MAG: AAA family ATPase [Candidatus Diapherotrites archaeon]|nr:AAA family ATPase [Candidatus Diapherotrites archaeon]
MPLEEIIRTKTGIQNLDKALNGGFPQGNIVLVSGGAGTGKSTFCLQYLLNGATLFGEKGLYVSTEQNKAELMKQARGFNWNLTDLEQKNLIKIVFFDITGADGFPERLNTLIQEFKPKRLIIDSLTTLTDSLIVSGIGNDKEFSLVQIAETVNPIPRTEQIVTKNILYRLFKEIKKFGVTTLLTSELPEDQRTLSADGVSEFVADGVIVFKSLTVGDSTARNLEIKKMRYTQVDGGLKAYDFTKDGIILL